MPKRLMSGYPLGTTKSLFYLFFNLESLPIVARFVEGSGEHGNEMLEMPGAEGSSQLLVWVISLLHLIIAIATLRHLYIYADKNGGYQLTERFIEKRAKGIKQRNKINKEATRFFYILDKRKYVYSVIFMVFVLGYHERLGF